MSVFLPGHRQDWPEPAFPPLRPIRAGPPAPARCRPHVSWPRLLGCGWRLSRASPQTSPPARGAVLSVGASLAATPAGAPAPRVTAGTPCRGALLKGEVGASGRGRPHPERSPQVQRGLGRSLAGHSRSFPPLTSHPARESHRPTPPPPLGGDPSPTRWCSWRPEHMHTPTPAHAHARPRRAWSQGALGLRWPLGQAVLASHLSQVSPGSPGRQGAGWGAHCCHGGADAAACVCPGQFAYSLRVCSRVVAVFRVPGCGVVGVQHWSQTQVLSQEPPPIPESLLLGPRGEG